MSLLPLNQHLALMQIYDGLGCPAEDTVCTRFRASEVCVGQAVFCERGQVVSLRFDLTPVSGTLSTAIGVLSSLRFLYVTGRNVRGSIATEIGNAKSLTGLHIVDSSITGVLPTELGRLTALADLDLSGNVLLGSTLPTALEQLTLLRYINLSSTPVGGNAIAALQCDLSNSCVNCASARSCLCSRSPICVTTTTSTSIFDAETSTTSAIDSLTTASPNSGVIGGVVGGAVAAVVIIAVFIGMLVWLRFRTPSVPTRTPTNATYGAVPQQPIVGVYKPAPTQQYAHGNLDATAYDAPDI